MEYLLTAAVIALLFGLVFLFTPALLLKLGELFNRVVVYLDERLQPLKMAIGVLLLLLSGWLLYTVARYPELAYLNALWVVTLAFGLLFLFFPGWLKWLSAVSDKVVLSTDDVVIGSRKIIGVLLLISSLYIFLGAYFSR